MGSGTSAWSPDCTKSVTSNYGPILLSCHDQLEQAANLFIDSIKAIPMDNDRDIQFLIAKTLIQSASGTNGIYIDVVCAKLLALVKFIKTTRAQHHLVVWRFVSYFIYLVVLSLSPHQSNARCSLDTILDEVWIGHNVKILNFKYYKQNNAYLSAITNEVLPFTNYIQDIADIIVAFREYKYYSFIHDLNTLSHDVQVTKTVALLLLADHKRTSDNIAFTMDVSNATFLMQRSIQDNGEIFNGICEFFATYASITCITYSPKCFIKLLHQFKEFDTFQHTQNILMRLISAKSNLNSSSFPLFFLGDDQDRNESIEQNIKFIFDQIIIKYELTTTTSCADYILTRFWLDLLSFHAEGKYHSMDKVFETMYPRYITEDLLCAAKKSTHWIDMLHFAARVVDEIHGEIKKTQLLLDCLQRLQNYHETS